jgi:CubicO group peptidase (beta-lactamase class C family)
VRLTTDHYARRAQRVMTGVLVAGLLVTAACTSSDNSAATSTTTGATGTASAVSAVGTTSAGTANAVTATTTSSGAEPAYAAKVTAAVEKAMKDNVIPGAVVLISSPDQGEWTGTFGTGTWAAEVPLTVDDHFRIGSNTKTMTSTVILQLVQEGKLALDDPISKYIPGVPGGDTVTIANLSEMRSGLYSYSFGSNTSTIQTYALSPEDQQRALAGTLLPNNETMANPSWGWTAGGAISTVEDMKTYVEALVDGGLLDAQTQQVRMDSIKPTNPAEPSAGYGLGIAKFDQLYGHDGQIPGYMTFMGHDPKTGLTIVIGTNLATAPSGEGSALVILKELVPIFYPNAVIPGDPAAAPGATDAASATGSAPTTSTGG